MKTAAATSRRAGAARGHWPLWALAAAAAALGAAMSWAQAPHGHFYLVLAALPLAAHLADLAKSPKRAALIGWSFGVGYFIPGLLWIGEAFLVEADRFAWLLPFAVTLLPAYLSLFWAAAFAAARYFGGSVWSTTLFLGIAEYARAQAFTGFPWHMPAYGWSETPVAQTAAWIGPFGLTLLTIFAALALGRGVLGGAGLGAGLGLGLSVGLNGGAFWSRAIWGGSGAALIALGWIAGAARLDAAPPLGAAPADALAVRIIQPNVPQTEKWDRQYLQRNFDRLIALSTAPSEDALPPDLLAWPETAVVPWVVSDEANRVALMDRLASEWGGPTGVGPHLVLGTQRYEGSEDDFDAWNSLFALRPDGSIEATYDKHHLVPFGEFLPFQDLLEAIGIFQLAGGRGAFESGPGPQVVALQGLPSFGALICYEAIFPDEMPDQPARPDYLMHITNDAWFGASSGPHQHFAQARFRAIEQGLPMVRSANTGISAMIDGYGRVVASIPLNTMGMLDAKLPDALPPTPYARYGEMLFFALAALLAAIVLAIRAAAARHG